MENSAEEESLTAPISAKQTSRRVVRRRLVQSTLFPQQSSGIDLNDDPKVDADKDDKENTDDEDFCGSQGKKKRKRKEKTTPKKATPKKRVKGKSSTNSTPKKTITNNGAKSDGESAPPPIPNLRLEAKLRAEELSRMSEGKQIHPFFSFRKAGKRSHEAPETEEICCPFAAKDKNITMGPIHVFERIQDESPAIDWNNWTFIQNTYSNTSCILEGLSTSIYESSSEALDSNSRPGLCPSEALFIPDKMPGLCPSEALFIPDKMPDHVLIQQGLPDISPTVSSMLGSAQAPHCLLIEESDNDCEVEEVAFLSANACGVRKSCSSEGIRCMQQSNPPENNLWTDKYQPKQAMQVCGNTESVKRLNEWLCLWHEKSFQAAKDSTGNDRCDTWDDDYNGYGSDYDSENIDEGHRLKNVLLVTGPIGSGKSAAIHACAKEQGFKILESNASDSRNGAVVKQKFGEALESHCLTRSLDSPVCSQKKQFMKLTHLLPNGAVMHAFDEEVSELIPISDDGPTYGATETPGRTSQNESDVSSDRAKVKSLILFEDVDITFPEDRGFIAAIKQIAVKAKGPVILTSNNESPGLPDALNRLELCFTLPTSNELLYHLTTVSAAEKLDIEPQLLEQLIQYCQGDIRKAIMNLQFWWQSKKQRKARNFQKGCAPLLFDLGIGHLMLPKLIPWGFHSQLSELVEKEIAMSLSIQEEDSNLIEVIVEEMDDIGMLNSLGLQNGTSDSIEAKKEKMLKRCSLNDCNDFEDPIDTYEFLNSSRIQISPRGQKIRRKLNVVVSSDSEDELQNSGYVPDSNKNTNDEFFLDNTIFPSCTSMENFMNPICDELMHYEMEKDWLNYYHSVIANDSCINDSLKSVDVSCVPESSFVPETEFDNGAEELSSGQVVETVDVSVNEEFTQNPSAVEAENIEKYVHRLDKSSEMYGSTFVDIAGSSYGEEIEDSHNELMGGVSRGYQVLDECSRIDINKWSKPVEKYRSRVPNDLVQETWKRLRGGQTDVKQFVASEPKEAYSVVQLTYKMTNLISEVDMLFSSCQKLDSLEISVAPSKNSDACNWYDEQLRMASTMAQNGFCLYAKDIAARGPIIGVETSVDLSSDIFASTSNMMTLPMSFGQEAGLSNTSNAGMTSGISAEQNGGLNSERRPCLLNMIKSIVPPRSYSTLKGNAFHEYVSSLGCISRSDTTHSSENIVQTKRQRSRRARHYLSTGALTLSLKDISLVGRYSIYGKNNSSPLE